MESQNPQNSEASTTKPNLLYRFYSFGRSVVAWSFLAWLVYTIIYQIVDGWHWAPVSPSEKILDTVVGTCWEIGTIIMIISWFWKMDDIMEKSK